MKNLQCHLYDEKNNWFFYWVNRSLSNGCQIQLTNINSNRFRNSILIYGGCLKNDISCWSLSSVWRKSFIGVFLFSSVTDLDGWFMCINRTWISILMKITMSKEINDFIRVVSSRWRVRTSYKFVENLKLYAKQIIAIDRNTDSHVRHDTVT